MPTETITAPDPTDQTILGETGTPASTPSNKDSGVPNAEPNGQQSPDGSGKEPTKPPEGEGKPAQGQKTEPQPTAEPFKVADLKLPEGIELDPEIGSELEKLAAESKLPKDTVQKLVDLQSKLSLKMAETSAAEYRAMKTSWETETKKALGKDADQKLAYAAKFIEKFRDVVDPAALRAELGETGAGSRINLVKLFIAAGQAISEDSFAEGKLQSGSKDKTAGEILYPNLPKN